MERKGTIRCVLLVVGMLLSPLASQTSAWHEEEKSGSDGKDVFRAYCAVCHTVGEPWKKVGPPLNGLWRRKQLITGQPVSEQRVREIILRGGPTPMPGFQYSLTSSQLEKLLEFLKSS